MNTALQTLGPVLQQLIPMGNVQPFNALVMDWADSMDLDATPYLVPEMPPPQPEVPLPAGGEYPPLPPDAQSVVDAGISVGRTSTSNTTGAASMTAAFDKQYPPEIERHGQ